VGKPAPDTVEVRLRWENKELKQALREKAVEVDFFAAALRRVKRDRQARASMAIQRLLGNPRAGQRARQTEGGTNVLAGRSEQGRILSKSAGAASGRGRYGSTGSHSGVVLRHRRRYAYRRIAAELRAARDKGQSQAGSPADAGR
jgi:hypothetical protein